jgi:hypothetical protein
MPITLDDQLRAMDSLIAREKQFVTLNRDKYNSSFIAKKDRDIEIFETIRETVRGARQEKQNTGLGGKPIISQLDEIEDALKKFDGVAPYDSPGNLVRGDGHYVKHIERAFGASIDELRKQVQERKR